MDKQDLLQEISDKVLLAMSKQIEWCTTRLTGEKERFFELGREFADESAQAIVSKAHTYYQSLIEKCKLSDGEILQTISLSRRSSYDGHEHLVIQAMKAKILKELA